MSNTFLPIMSKEEAHDLFFGLEYADGTDFSKACSIKIERYIDKNNVTFVDVITYIKKLTAKFFYTRKRGS